MTTLEELRQKLISMRDNHMIAYAKETAVYQQLKDRSDEHVRQIGNEHYIRGSMHLDFQNEIERLLNSLKP